MSEKMREEFELWYVATFAVEGGWCNTDYAKELAWIAWQASRAALVVDLPSMTNNGHEGFYRESEVKRVMREAGVSYK
jgi:hypothetical protein